MIKGLVSIIIPTYNRADLVVEALHSVLSQTYAAKQIIVVDDGSSDETSARVAQLEGVEYHYQNNRGQGAARNLGLQFARGEYVASLDSDDVWDKDFLARSVECLENSALSFVFTNWSKVRNGSLQISEWQRDERWKRYRNRQRGEWNLLSPAETRRLFLALCPAPSSSLVIRREAIVSGWNERMRIADDWSMVLDAALRRPCHAGFSLTPRWRKRIDGNNVYDGRPFGETARDLHLHDYPALRREFRSLLTRRERLTMAGREAMYRLRLVLHRWAFKHLARRVN
jgi:glycosyltransferase involved in cell wall biosynthesis